MTLDPVDCVMGAEDIESLLAWTRENHVAWAGGFEVTRETVESLVSRKGWRVFGISTDKEHSLSFTGSADMSRDMALVEARSVMTAPDFVMLDRRSIQRRFNPVEMEF